MGIKQTLEEFKRINLEYHLMEEGLGKEYLKIKSHLLFTELSNYIDQYGSIIDLLDYFNDNELELQEINDDEDFEDYLRHLNNEHFLSLEYEAPYLFSATKEFMDFFNGISHLDYLECLKVWIMKYRDYKPKRCTDMNSIYFNLGLVENEND